MKLQANKLILSLVAAAVIAGPISTGIGGGHTVYAAKQTVRQAAIQVYVDGVKLKFDNQPVQKKGSTLVQLKPIFAALKAEVTWVQSTQTVIVRKDGTTVTLKIGAKRAVKNGASLQLALPAETVKGATMVPLRFVSEALGAKLDWNTKTQTVQIVSAQAASTAVNNAPPQPAPAAKGILTAADVVDMNDDKVVMISTDKAQGSGLVLSDRWILTNFHVMQGANSGTVYLNDGTALAVQGIVKYDRNSDLAIIRTVESIGVEPVELGSYFDVRKGDRVYAIGSPLGMQNTISTGLISNSFAEGGIQYFQTNAQIDHGSSGGGLFNEQGKLIGITSSGIDDTSADLNFAISIEHVFRLTAGLSAGSAADGAAAFLPSALPDSLTDASTEDIRELIEDQFSQVQTSQGTASFSNWTVTRDAQNWLVISAQIDSAYYTLYGHKTEDELRFYFLNIGSELKRMLPDEKIQVLVYYDQTFAFEPRGFASGEATPTGDGKWRLRYPVIDMQQQDKLHIEMRF
jgi:S1-C subfamily serine protease